MFCPECGTKNDDDALFCENCGKKIKDGSEKIEIIQDNEQKSAEVNNQAKQDVNTTITPRKPIRKKTKMIIGLVAVVSIAIIIFSVVGKKLTNPERIALNYFKDVAAADWEKVYNYYDLSESEFINKEMYKKAVAKNEKIDYTVCAIKKNTNIADLIDGADSNKIDCKDEGISRTIKIEYALKNSDTATSTYTVKLVKSSKNKFLFFDNWKVVPEDMIAKNYSIRTLKEVKVFIDGKKLSKKYLSEDESNNEYESSLDIYKIPSIFKGTHKIEFKGDFIETYKDSLKIRANSEYNYSYTNPDIKNDFIEVLEKKTEDIVKKIYEAALDDKNFKDLKLPCEIYEDTKDDLKDRYDDLVDNMKKTSYASEIKVKSLKLNEFEITDQNSYIDNGTISATISYKSEYSGEFVKKIDNKEEKKKDDGNITGTVSFRYDDGEWKISRIYNSRIYYYWY